MIDHYSRFVTLARWGCFAGAAALCLLLVTVNRNHGTGHQPDFAMTSNQETDTNAMTLKLPRLVGLDNAMRPYEITAEIARQPMQNGLIRLEQLKADVAVDAEVRAIIEASGASYDLTTQTIALLDGVQLQDSRGYALQTPEMTIDIRSQQASSNGPVNGRSPMGTIDADSMQIVDAGQKIVFKGRTKIELTGEPVVQ